VKEETPRTCYRGLRLNRLTLTLNPEKSATAGAPVQSCAALIPRYRSRGSFAFSPGIFSAKAASQKKEAYSAFEDTRLAEYLVNLSVDRTFVGGVATNYCVKSTVLDGVANGFETFLLKDAARGVNLKLGDSAKAIEEIQKHGVQLVTIDDVNVSLLGLRPEWSR